MTITGRRIIWPAPGQIALEDFAVTPPGAGEVLIETDCTVISPGTELAVLQAKDNTPKQFPYRPGYSGAGRIIALGDGVSGLAVGDRVVMDHLGHTSHACCAVAGWREQGLTTIDAEVPSQAAAFLPIASMSLQGVRKTRPELGESALIVGLGLLGLFALRFASLSGTHPLLAIDPDPARRRLALAFGADAAVDPAGDELAKQMAGLGADQGFDLIIESSGALPALQRALPLLAECGRLSLLGCLRGKADDLDLYWDVHKKGAVVIGAHNYIRPRSDSHPGYWTTRDDYRTLLDLLRTRRLAVEPLISAVVPPSEAPAIYRRFLDREPGLLGVVFDWRI